MWLRSPLVAALLLGAIAARPLRPQSGPPSGATTPDSWLQLRGGSTNNGVIPGSLLAEWNFKAPHAVRGLSVVDGMVLIGTESGDADQRTLGSDERGYVAALGASSGKVIWGRGLSTWVHGDPTFYQGVVYVTTGQRDSTTGAVTALDARSGQTIWTFPVAGGLMPAGAIDTTNRSIVVAGRDGVLFALSMATGAVEHTVGLRGFDAMSSPRMDSQDGAYLGAGGALIRYSPRTGQIVWTFRRPEFRYLSDVPVALNDTVVFTTGTHPLAMLAAFRALPVGRFIVLLREAMRDGENRLSAPNSWFWTQSLLAIDRRDGHLLWNRPLGVGVAVAQNKSGTPVLAQQRVFVSSPVSQTLWAFDASSGRALWSRQLNARHKGAVTVVGDDLVFGDHSGQLIWIRADSGVVTGHCDAGAAFTVLAPVVIGQTLIAATHDGWVHAAPYEQVRQRAVGNNPVRCFSPLPH